jgi:hypothetical protein
VPPPPPDASVPPPPPDASVPPPPDASVPPPPDAHVNPPDAALPPDAAPPPPTTASFTATRDTQLYSPDPTFNFGDFLEIICANETGLDSPVLYGWNLSSIPTTATVQSAVLHISTSTNALTSGGSVTIYKLLQDWTEGAQDGAPGVANYNDRQVNTPWATSGARGGSRATNSSASFAPTSANTTYDVSLPVALVQAWVSSPGTNFGVVMTASSGQDVAFFTHDTTVASAKRPRLTVTYVP